MAKIKPVVTDIPGGNYSKYGFGTFPIREDWDVRNAAVQRVLSILDGNTVEKDNDTLAALSTVKGLFSRVYVRDCWDWFTVCRQLAYPGHDLSKEISLALGNYRAAILSDDAGRQAELFSKLSELPVPEMLEHFIDLNVKGKHLIDEAGFAFILWSQSKANEYFVGATTRTIDNTLKFVRERFPENAPYGVVGAYLVDDALEVRDLLKNEMEDLYAYRGLYRGELVDIRERVESVIQRHHQLRNSPWDGADPELEETVEQEMAL
ncbi:hypothetical protein [Rhizobium sp. MHM7A]|uniref:hypothetical protein n=1 Tax=Rhizobium sp. MHM7A TaxID=2583233 RepID=UPI0011072CBA|nr:hypothetical protein [Rhizobium sp. MHM7A]TLX15867.1 hypothetical protein FFR93_00705 [Rhizobium sp. MHM7A]